jgi:hypothetical protein
MYGYIYSDSVFDTDSLVILTFHTTFLFVKRTVFFYQMCFNFTSFMPSLSIHHVPATGYLSSMGCAFLSPHSANEGLVRIGESVPIYVFPEMKLCGLVIS